MIGPLHLNEAPAHIGYDPIFGNKVVAAGYSVRSFGPFRMASALFGLDPLCVCCCAVEDFNVGGTHGFGSVSVASKPFNRDNPFLKFNPIVKPLETDLSESVTIDEVELKDHFEGQFWGSRAAVDGLPDKAEAGAPHAAEPGLAHQSDFELQEEYEFLMLILASEACC